jgi:hypothetical protein
VLTWPTSASTKRLDGIAVEVLAIEVEDKPGGLHAVADCLPATRSTSRTPGVALGTGYPGTPSTEILERFSELGGHAQWSPNEKVALEVALGVPPSPARARW